MQAFAALLLYILYLATYLPHVSLSACIYNESYIYVTTENYPDYNGAYVRNLNLGILTQNPLIGQPPQCGINSTHYSGTYIYETQNEPKKYLWMFGDGVGNGLKIGTGICDGNAVFETYSSDTKLILDGTNCVWSDVDSDNAIIWKVDATGDDVVGTFVLCDATEGCFTPDPTSHPTLSPVPTTAIPTENPTTATPTASPTESTSTPSKSPTKSPTIKPTPLPTTAKAVFLEPPCVALTVTNLDKAFPLQAAYSEKFNQIDGGIYNQRRVWHNGANRLEIFYTDRYEPNRWVISNGTYHLVNDREHLVDGGVNNSFPAGDDGYGLYDHFPNDNIHKKAETKYTLTFVCQNASVHGTRFPSESPTPFPSPAPSLAPSAAPTAAPSAAPTIECGTLLWKYGKDNDSNVITDCKETVQFETQFLRIHDKEYNNHSWWRNYVTDRDEEKLFYSNIWEGWIFNMEGEQGNIGDHSVYIRAERGLEMPPVEGTWWYFDHGDLYSPHCSVEVKISCSAALPTSSTTTEPPSPAPSITPTHAPSYSPSGSPTSPPSVAPSQPPSVAPTFAPTLLCGGLEVDIEYTPIEGVNDEYAYFVGNYRRQDDDDLNNEKFWWLSRDIAGSTIFYSDVAFHNSWVIMSLDAQSYWLYPEYNPYIHWLQPPLFGEWQYYTPLSPFASDRRNITLHCAYSLLPTPAPSLAPSSAPTSPPTNAPSIAPTLAPSVAPSFSPSTAPTTAPTTPAPSNAPSAAPSLAPTAPPTREACGWMQVRAEDELLSPYEGIYDTIIGGRNGFAAWVLANENGVFIIEKTSNGLYWSINKQDGGTISITDLVTLDNVYNWRPPEYGDWLFWKIRPNPTTAPTTPTLEPTYNPTMEPTLDPTGDPTFDPTIDPTSDPTYDPTADPTFDPTMDPTSDPTHDPTLEPTLPTQDPTYFPSEDPTIDPTVEPTQPTDVPSPSPTTEPTVPTDQPSAAPTIPTKEPTFEPTMEPTQIPTHFPTFEPTTVPSRFPTFEPTVEPTKDPTAPTPARRRNLLQDPPQGTQVYGNRYKITMDCVNTGSPTRSPTTAEPTMAPTSSCHSILITAGANETVAEDLFPYFGEYIRAHYKIDDMYWFLSYDGLSSLRYFHGAWRIQREDKDDGNDEDTVLIYRNVTKPNAFKWLRLSPQNMPWYLIYHDMEIHLNINCLDSLPPTPAPTANPTSAPTAETKPVWIDCKPNWFTFIDANAYENDDGENSTSYGVYWNVPRAQGEDTQRVKVEIVNNATIQQGDELDTGTHSILYRATNIYNINDSDALYSDCEVTLYVIGNTQSATTQYCQLSKFSVNIQFNETYQEIIIAQDDASEEIEYEIGATLNINGFATNPYLDEHDANCYVFASKLLNFTEIIAEDADTTKAFLGIELQAIIWDVVVLLLLLCLCALCIFRICAYYKAYKANADPSDSKVVLLEDDLQRERVASTEQDDDDLDLDDMVATRGPGSSRSAVTKRKSKDGELLAAEPGHAEYQPPGMLSDDAEDVAIDRNETAGAVDGAIDVLIGEAFGGNESDPVLSTPGPKGGDIEMQQQKSVPLEPLPLGVRQSTFDDGGSLPDEPMPSDPMISDPVLVTPENAPIDHPVDEEIVPVPSKVPDVMEEKEEEEEAVGLPDSPNLPAAPYQVVQDESTGALHQEESLIHDPQAQDVRRPLSNDQYAELEESDDDDSEFEFRV